MKYHSYYIDYVRRILYMSTPIYKEVAENILAYIRKEQCTGRIPGMLKFAEILHVHHKTVKKAVHYLVERGILEVRGTSGTFVREKKNRRPKRNIIGIVGISVGPLTEDFLRPLRKKAEENNYSLMTIEFNSALFRENRTILQNFPLDGILFRGSSLLKEQFGFLIRDQIPFTAAVPSLTKYCDVVEFDHAAGYGKLLKELLAKGYKRIAFIEFARPPEYRYYIKNIRKVFMDILQEDFDPVLFHIMESRQYYINNYGGCAGERFLTDAARYFSAMEEPPEILISPVQSTFSAAENVPGCQYVFVGNMEQSYPENCGMMKFDEEERLLQGLSFLIRRCEGEISPYHNVKLPPSLIDLSCIRNKSKNRVRRK